MAYDLLLLLAISTVFSTCVFSACGSPVPFESWWAVPGKMHKLTGFYPAEKGKFPVLLVFAGRGDGYPTYVWSVFAYQMALRGFVSANVEYEEDLEKTAPNEDLCEKLYTQATWIYLGSASALEQVCEIKQADCSKGVAVAGHNQGSFIASYGPLNSRNVTAVLSLGSGYRSCMSSDHVVSSRLSKNKRRLINGHDDSTLTLGKKNIEESVMKMSKDQSGYDCGNNVNCIQADGSGHYLVTDKDFVNASCPEFSIGNSFFFGEEDDVSDGSIQAGTAFLCDFLNTSAEWGLSKNLDWLTQAASTNKSKKLKKVAMTYMGQPIPCLSKCPSEYFAPQNTWSSSSSNSLKIGAFAGFIACCCCILSIAAIIRFTCCRKHEDFDLEDSSSSTDDWDYSEDDGQSSEYS